MKSKEVHTTFYQNDLHQKVASLLAYFDIFNYPISCDDISQLIDYPKQEINVALRNLKKSGLCYEHANYYALQENCEFLLETRRLSEDNAKKNWQKAQKYVQKIANFPFVQGIAISGSLSKGVISENGDIDYFIITSPNRLWLARTLLVLYKKICLLNSHKYFCINYFVDTNNLEVIDKNLFTAMEVAHIVPVFQEQQLFEKFYSQNQWIADYFPIPIPVRKKHSNYSLINEIKSARRKSLLERLLSGKIGDLINNWAHRQTMRRWMKKFSHFNKEKFELTMRSTKGVSKHHPQDYQSKVLKAHNERLTKLIDRYNNFLSSKTRV